MKRFDLKSIREKLKIEAKIVYYSDTLHVVKIKDLYIKGLIRNIGMFLKDSPQLKCSVVINNEILSLAEMETASEYAKSKS